MPREFALVEKRVRFGVRGTWREQFYIVLPAGLCRVYVDVHIFREKKVSIISHTPFLRRINGYRFIEFLVISSGMFDFLTGL